MIQVKSLGRTTVISMFAVLAIVACSPDDAVVDIPSIDEAPGNISSFADVKPDISPRGYVALACGIHAAFVDLDPGALVNQRDPEQGAYEAIWSLLIAAGIWNPEAYGDLVEPASTLELVHPQGAWEDTADERNTITRECTDLGRSATGDHVYAAYACGIADRVAEQAPDELGIDVDRRTPVEDEINAVASLARAAWRAGDDYRQLGRRAESFHLTRVDEDLRTEYGPALKRLRTTCGKLG